MKTRNYAGVGALTFIITFFVRYLFQRLGFIIPISIYQMIIIALIFQGLAMLQYIIDKFEV